MTVYSTAVDAMAIHESGWYPLDDDFEVIAIPPIDVSLKTPDGDPMFARPNGHVIRAFGRIHGARPLTVKQFLQRHELAIKSGTLIQAVILPNASMRAAVPRHKGETDDAYGRRLYAPMGSLEWCRTFDVAVWAQLKAMMAAGKLGPFANIGKPEVRRESEKPDVDPVDMCLAGSFTGGKFIQPPNEIAEHGPTHTDNTKVGDLIRERKKVVIVDCGASSTATSSPATPAKLADLFRPAKRTPHSAKAVHDAIIAAHRIVFKDEPIAEEPRTLAAMYLFETGDGRSCWCNNLFNVQQRKGKPYTTLRNVVEYIDGKPKTFGSINFSAFDDNDLVGAVVAWFEFMLSIPSRYAKPIEILRTTAEPVAFCKALKVGGYYSAPLDKYTAGVVAKLKSLDDVMLDVDAALATLGYTDVKAFQRASKLDPDGIVGPKTRAALKKALGQ